MVRVASRATADARRFATTLVTSAVTAHSAIITPQRAIRFRSPAGATVSIM